MRSEPWEAATLGAASGLREELAAVGDKLRGGLTERNVCAWFGVPLVSDARHARGPARAARRGVGAWIALWVAGEPVEAQALAPLDGRDLAALEGAGLIARDGERVAARASLVPFRGALVFADRLDDRSPRAVLSPDVSAWNVAACLPAGARTLLDVGTGAGSCALAAARAGAKVVGTDVDGRALAFAALNALCNRVEALFLEGDLFAGVEERFDAVCFNAPLARADLALASGGSAPLYLHAPRGEALITEFLDGARARVEERGEALCHAQMTERVERAVLASGFPRQLELHFADALGGTPHALVQLEASGRPAWSRVRTPLGPALPHLAREPLERIGQTRDLLAAGGEALGAAVLRPAPWLLLTRAATHDGARFREREVRLGAARLGVEELALIERCDGRTVAELEAEPETLKELIEAGLLVA